jgi:tetratricopeptide (TPR) repeat protein
MNNVLLFIFLAFVLTTGCKEKTAEESEQRDARTLHTDDIPPFSSREAEENYFKGNDARHAGDMALAKQYYTKSYELDSTHIINLNNLGNACLDLGEYEKAAFCFRKGIRLAPDKAISYINYSNLYIRLHQYEEGITFVKAALETLDNEEMEAYLRVNLAMMYSFTEKCEEARQELELSKPYLEEGLPAFAGIEKEIDENCR